MFRGVLWVDADEVDAAMEANDDGLTDMQRRFVEEYVKNPNATEAYRKAGYKSQGRAAENNASRLMGNDRVKSAIEIALRAKSEQAKVDAAWVLTELVKNAKRASQAEPVRDSNGLPIGEYRYDGATVNGSLKLIGLHLGMFPQKREVYGKDGKDLFPPPGLSDEELRKLSPEELAQRHQQALGLGGK